MTALAAASYRRVLRANDRVQVGFIGYGLIGRSMSSTSRIRRTSTWPPCAMSASRAWKKGLRRVGPGCQALLRFPQDARQQGYAGRGVSTPDHWHALLTIMSCAAGKDVYVEKPLTLFVKEGRWMVNAARKYKRIVQCGTQQRSGKHYQNARELMRVRLYRPGGERAHGQLSQCHAGIRRPAGRCRAQGSQLRHVARSGAGAPI